MNQSFEAIHSGLWVVSEKIIEKGWITQFSLKNNKKVSYSIQQHGVEDNLSYELIIPKETIKELGVLKNGLPFFFIKDLFIEELRVKDIHRSHQKSLVMQHHDIKFLYVWANHVQKTIDSFIVIDRKN